MGETIIEQGYKLVIGRNRTHITTYENLRLHTTQPMDEDKPKKIKPSIPSDYADHNYYNRIKQRRSKIRELAYNSFEFENSVMITLTFNQPMTELEQAHYEFKKFIQRINSHYDGFRHLATFNRQKNGNWHYHVLCNLKPTTKNKFIRDLWGKGITYITYFEKQTMFDTAIKYLISNMEESAGETKGKHGYLASDNLEKNIVLKSYKLNDIKEFDEAFERILESRRNILYSTKHNLGIQGETVNEETGEVATYTVPNIELTPHYEQAGYSSWDSIFTHLSSSARFDEKFSILQTATPKPKKFKRAKRPQK